VSKIYLCGITPCPPHPKIAKASLGAEDFVSYEYIRDTWRIVTELKKRGVLVYGLELTKDAVDLFKFKVGKAPLALIIGNEVKGISPKILKYCDKIFFIPMNGKKESLNVSVSAGVALYKLLE
jgi:tRNA G18 (ribose-2'-O)-methylase SpoU